MLVKQGGADAFVCHPSGPAALSQLAHMGSFSRAYSMLARTFSCSALSCASFESSLMRGNGVGLLCFCTNCIVLDKKTPLRSGKVTQYLSVKQGTCNGSRVIISSEKRVSGRDCRTSESIRGRSRKPCPSTTSESRKPSLNHSTPISFTCVEIVNGANISVTLIGSSSSAMLFPKSRQTPRYSLEWLFMSAAISSAVQSLWFSKASGILCFSRIGSAVSMLLRLSFTNLRQSASVWNDSYRRPLNAAARTHSAPAALAS